MTSAAFQSKPHHLTAVIKTRPKFREYFDTAVPELAASLASAGRAAELRKQATAEDDRPPLQPSAIDVTEEWVEAEVDRRLNTGRIEARIQVLREVEFAAREEANRLIERYRNDMIRLLSEDLSELVNQARDAVSALKGARTPIAAINTGVAEHWKRLSDMRASYDQIRTTQRALYRPAETGGGDVLMFDGLPFGQGVTAVTDPEARIYFHKNLDAVAPNWRGRTVMRVHHPSEIPWPSAPTEQLIWFIDHDSGIWCPTEAQLERLLAGKPTGSERLNVPPPAPRLDRRLSERQTLKPSMVSGLR